MSLVELLMASGVMSIVALIFASQMISQKKATLQIQTLVTRNLLQMRLQQALTVGSTIQTTANHSTNTSFKNCLIGTSATCSGSTNWIGVKLLDVSNTELAGASSSQPIRYNHEGIVCSSASPQCLYRVYSQYQAICPTSAPCTPAQASVQVRFTIDQDPTITPLGGTPLAALTPPGVFVSSAGSSLQPPSAPCSGSGKALQWNGSGWVCGSVNLASRTVNCIATLLFGTTYGCQANCAPDEIVTGGGMAWGSVFSNAGRNSYKNSNGWHCSINVGSCSGGLTGGCGSECYAICTKLNP